MVLFVITTSNQDKEFWPRGSAAHQLGSNRGQALIALAAKLKTVFQHIHTNPLAFIFTHEPSASGEAILLAHLFLTLLGHALQLIANCFW
jgi:hypothetical protein